jgi:hypothetical protein
MTALVALLTPLYQTQCAELTVRRNHYHHSKQVHNRSQLLPAALTEPTEPPSTPASSACLDAKILPNPFVAFLPARPRESTRFTALWPSGLGLRSLRGAVMAALSLERSLVCVLQVVAPE